MRFHRLFPLADTCYRTCATFLLTVGFIFSGLVIAAANGKQKPVARPVARLVGAAPFVRARAITSTRSVPSTVAAATRVSPAATVAATSDEQRTFDLINAARRERGATPLLWDGELCRLARLHSENMARQGFFSHNGPDGQDTDGRARSAGVRGWRSLGENIAYNMGYDDPAAFAVERWMRSAKHRENILNAGFTHSGLGIAKAADGRVFFTQVFLTR